MKVNHRQQHDLLQIIRNVKRRLALHVTDEKPDLSSTSSNNNNIQRINPLETYFSVPRDQVATTAPFFVLPSCLLPPGHVTTTTTTTTTTSTSNSSSTLRNPNIFVYRDQENHQIHAFVNQCRHRGARLVKQQPSLEQKIISQNNGLQFSSPLRGKGKSVLLTCPYHAWTYNLPTGTLVGVPGQELGFPCLEKEKHGLIQLECFESAGGIWVGGEMKNNNLDEHHDPSSASTLPPTTSSSPPFWQSIDSEISAWILPPKTNCHDAAGGTTTNIVGYREWDLNANWQLLVETFLEAYHVRYLHKETLARVAHSNIMVTDVLDDHSFRMTVPLKHFGATADDEDSGMDNKTNDVTDPAAWGKEMESFLGQTTTTYFLFPSTAISIFKRFATYLSIVPSEEQGPSARSHVRLWAVTHNHNRNVNDSHNHPYDGTHHYSDHDHPATLAALRDFENVIHGIEEDWACAEEIQSGLTSSFYSSAGNTKPSFLYGRFEGNNVTFLNNVDLVSEQIKQKNTGKEEQS